MDVTMLSFILVLLIAAGVAEGRLEFLATQRNHDVSLNCTFRNIESTNLNLIISMSVSRLTNNQEVLLASVTSVGARPISNGGVVTSNIVIDGSQDSFINIEWASANSSVAGYYICKVTGLDLNNSPVVLNETLTFALRDPGPGVKVTPGKLEIEFSQILIVRCYISDLPAHSLSQVTSIDLNVLREGIDQIIATVSFFEAAEAKPGSGADYVTGSVGNGDESFLEVIWKKPGLNKTGTYQCVFDGLSTRGAPVFFQSNYTLALTDYPKDVLINKLIDLQNKFEKTSSDYTILATKRDDLLLRIRVQEESLKGHRICDDVNLPVGQHHVTLFPDDGSGLVDVICDVISPRDVWTIFQKRVDGTESFKRSFFEYEHGFGSPPGEYWLGLQKIKRIMGSGKYQLRVDITDHKGVNYSRVYPTFDLGPSDGYRLLVSGYNDGGHGLSFSSGAEFSTMDHGPQPHCAAQDNGGWWYDNCAYTNLNGLWGQPGEGGVSWFELAEGRTHPLSSTQMKFRRVNVLP